MMWTPSRPSPRTKAQIHAALLRQLEQKPLKFINRDGEPLLIAHFPGHAASSHQPAVQTFLQICPSVPANITIVTFASEKIINEALLIRQLNRTGVNYLNPARGADPWVGVKKLERIIETLPKVTTEWTLLLDGFDVLLCGDLAPIFERFDSYGHNILFGSCRRPSPPFVVLEKIEDRDWRGECRHVNSGTGFGRTADLMPFYERAWRRQQMPDMADNTNEQKVVRMIFAEDTKSVGFDWKCRVFQDFGFGAEINQIDDIVTVS